MMGCDGGGDGEMENRRNVLKRTVAALRLVRHAEACGSSLRTWGNPAGRQLQQVP